MTSSKKPTIRESDCKCEWQQASDGKIRFWKPDCPIHTKSEVIWNLSPQRGEGEIQLPTDKEAERCVLIVIEDHIGVISKTEVRNGLKYAIVTPYQSSPQTGEGELDEAKRSKNGLNQSISTSEEIEKDLEFNIIEFLTNNNYINGVTACEIAEKLSKEISEAFLHKHLSMQREAVINDFVHTTTDLFGEGEATDFAFIVADKLRSKLLQKEGKT